mgnify:CR=1 FL=1
MEVYASVGDLVELTLPGVGSPVRCLFGANNDSMEPLQLVH